METATILTNEQMALYSPTNFTRVHLNGWYAWAGVDCVACDTTLKAGEIVFNEDETANFMCESCFTQIKNYNTPTFTDLLSAMGGRLYTQENGRMMKVIHEVVCRGLSNRVMADGRDVYNFSIRYTDTKGQELWTTFQVTTPLPSVAVTTKYAV